MGLSRLLPAALDGVAEPAPPGPPLDLTLPTSAIDEGLRGTFTVAVCFEFVGRKKMVKGVGSTKKGWVNEKGLGPRKGLGQQGRFPNLNRAPLTSDSQTNRCFCQAFVTGTLAD